MKRRATRRHQTILVNLLIALGGGCVEPLDAFGPAEPQPFEANITVHAQDQGYPNPVVEIAFTQHVQPNVTAWVDAITVRQSPVQRFGYPVYSVIDRALYLFLQPEQNPGLVYEIAVDETRIEDVRGIPLSPVAPVEWDPQAPPAAPSRTIPADVLPPQDPALSFSQSVAPLLVACTACHGAEGGPAAMRYETLVGVRSDSRPDAMRVDVGRPARSVLIHRVVPDHPLAINGQMPPVHSGVAPLSSGEIRVLERWIREGARP